MKIKGISQNNLQEVKVNLKVKISMLWVSLMFLIIYLDYFHLYMPHKIEGKVFVFQISQGFLLGTLASITIPALMVFFSVALPSALNRWTNIIIAALYIPFMLFNLAGEAWLHMIFGAAVEVVVLCLVIRYAWKWPRIEI